ncbi:MAG: heme o synthase [Mycobacteriales bacterium]
MTTLAGLPTAPSSVDRTAPRRRGARLRAYVALTKPRIIELLLVTTVPTMVLADRGLPPLGLLLATLVGGTLAAASANTINCFFDRDIDEQMRRTARRPLPRHAVSPRAALRFGIVLGITSFALLAVAVNLLAAVLAGVAIAFYVVVYTLAMKRTTPSNIVIGGAAGCMPVLVGWAAVTGRLDATAWALFAIVFYWTPPHFWALALRFRDDYARAGVPMLPVVAGDRETARQIVLYTWLLVAVSLLLYPVGRLGTIYLSAALVLGGVFLVEAHALARRARAAVALRPMRLFHWSITYLTLLFAAIAADQLVR